MHGNRLLKIAAMLTVLAGCNAVQQETDRTGAEHADDHGTGTDLIDDPWIRRLVMLAGNRTPPDPAPDSFGQRGGRFSTGLQTGWFFLLPRRFA